MKILDEYILGIRDNIKIEEYENINLTKKDDLHHIFIKRKRDSHKGTYGRVGMLSGSKGMAGACVLNINAALRSGSGLVKAFITDSIYSVVESMSIESLTYTFDEIYLNLDELKKELIDFSDVIATGSGCTNLKNYNSMLQYLMENYQNTLVIDAEGINQLNSDMLKNHKQNIILTPHHGEMARLLKKDVSYLRTDIAKKSAHFANKFNLFLVLKGARTLIACPDGEVYINTSGNPGMATAGSGDVLTGIIASFIGQSIEIKNALRAAVYVHGFSGDLAAEQFGEYSLIAGDLIKYLPKAIQFLNK